MSRDLPGGSLSLPKIYFHPIKVFCSISQIFHPILHRHLSINFNPCAYMQKDVSYSPDRKRKEMKTYERNLCRPCSHITASAAGVTRHDAVFNRNIWEPLRALCARPEGPERGGGSPLENCLMFGSVPGRDFFYQRRNRVGQLGDKGSRRNHGTGRKKAHHFHCL